MSLSYEFASKFADCAKTALKASNDFSMKAETLEVLKQMKRVAAEGNPIAQYYLAQVYAKNSSSYYKWMEASAEQGFTNAMLALAQTTAEKGKTYAVQKAASYVIKILSTDDSYIKDEVKALLVENPALATEVERKMSSISKSGMGFFAQEAKQEAKNGEFDLPALDIKVKRSPSC